MKDVIRYIGMIVFYVFVVVVLLWTASLTLGMVKTVLPNDQITPWFALALFDGGAVTWLLVFVGFARGLGQRSVSLLMLCIDILGVVLMSGAELIMSGQHLAAVPEGLGTIVVYAVGGWTALNLIAGYAFHIFSPEIAAQIEMQVAQDKLEAEALEQAKSYLVDRTPELAQYISNRLITRAKADMRLLETKNKIIDGKAKDVPDKQNPT